MTPDAKGWYWHEKAWMRVTSVALRAFGKANGAILRLTGERWCPLFGGVNTSWAQSERAKKRNGFNAPIAPRMVTSQSSTPPAYVDNPAPRVEEDPPVALQTPSEPETGVEPAARGLAAVTAKPPVAGLTGGSASAPCSCPDWWKKKMASFQEEDANESHHEACGRYRKGAHRWPMPVQGVEGDEPFTVQCRWCGETREVDRLGVPWVVSEKNPANGGKVPV